MRLETFFVLQLACRTFLPRRVMAKGGIQLGWETMSETFQHVSEWIKFNPGKSFCSVKPICLSFNFVEIIFF